MTTAWWGREALDRTAPGEVNLPQLSQQGRDAIFASIEAKIAAYTPEWRQRTSGDAGDALLHLHSELAEPLVARVNRLPEKALREFLRTAGICAASERPARAMLNFTVSPAAPSSVLIPTGFQVSAPAADGSGQTIVFETEQTLYAAPGEIAMSVVQEGDRFYPIELNGSDPNNAIAAFGSQPKIGSALLIGLSSAVAPSPNITLAFRYTADDGPPPAIAAGGSAPVATAPMPILRWSFFDGGSFETAEVIRDETRGLTQSGALELRCPRHWRSGTPTGITAEQALRWLRVQLIAGEFSAPPSLAFIQLNAVTAIAARTVHNEVLEYVPDSNARRLRLSQGPLLAESLHLTVNEGGFGNGAQIRWQPVDDLNAYGPDDRVFELDATTRELQFGDGVHGAALPGGYRHVVAERYQIATGSGGAVDAEQITNLLSSAPFLTGVSNVLPASGGHDAELLSTASLRGPQQIRSRGYAVTMADYCLLALSAPGANVVRAHTVAGTHAGLDDAQVPGTVSVYVLGPATAEAPPYPDQDSLHAVVDYLTKEVAPAGIEVVAAAPYFHRISVRATLVVADRADAGNVLRSTLRTLDSFFDPLVGGVEGRGWPFGGTLQHTVLVQQLIACVPDLIAVSALNLTVDGETLPTCDDLIPRPHSLLWPLPHELRLVTGGNT